MTRPVTPFAFQAGTRLIPETAIVSVDTQRLEELEVALLLTDGTTAVAQGLDAIEAVLRLKPSAFEGRRLAFAKGAWVIHNLVAHPLMQILALFGCYRWAFWVHDRTVPRPLGRHPRWPTPHDTALPPAKTNKPAEPA